MQKSRFTQKRALNLRRNLTEAEKLLWHHLRGKNIAHKFRRQEPIDRYIADFVCFEKRLIVELDGGQHTVEKDAERTQYLESQGFMILRFWNHDVLQNVEGVLRIIQESCAAAPSPALRATSPARGEVKDV
ncbi:MAG: very-short-patch-repair endonuclease [Alphaproteobacteria bacterium]|nr:very-short-patch-repair endonuclease [Alphaproteobacteria bacterium]